MGLSDINVLCNWRKVIDLTGLEKNYENLKIIMYMLTRERERERERKKKQLSEQKDMGEKDREKRVAKR